jgi:predicted dehydrogenase
MMGVEHILNINSVAGTVVTAAADPHQPSLDAAVEAAAGERPIATFSDHRELLDSGLCDAVVLASPNFTHADLLGDIFASGLHVLIEKPMCITVEECERVIALAAETAGVNPDRKIWVGLEYRYMPPVAALIDEVRGGAVGTTRMVAIREHRFPFLVKVGNWNRFSRNTGGTLVEKCCHFFDLMHLASGSHPVRVMASGGQDVNHLDETYEIDGRVERPDILDNAFVIVEFANGVRGALDLCMFAEGGRFEQELTIVGDAAKMEATVPGDVVWLGERAAAGAPGTNPGGGVRGVPAPMDPRVPYPDFHQGASFMEHLALVDAIRDGQPAAVTVTEGLWAVATGAAAHRSIDERRPVELAEFGLG